VENEFIIGESLVIDGGMTMRIIYVLTAKASAIERGNGQITASGNNGR
jgi:hypothetical protein